MLQSVLVWVRSGPRPVDQWAWPSYITMYPWPGSSCGMEYVCLRTRTTIWELLVRSVHNWDMAVLQAIHQGTLETTPTIIAAITALICIKLTQIYAKTVMYVAGLGQSTSIFLISTSSYDQHTVIYKHATQVAKYLYSLDVTLRS